MKLNDIAYFVEDKISSENIKLDQYVTTDSLLQNKKGRTFAQNLPPQKCSLVHFKKGDVLLGNIRPYLKKIWYANIEGGCSQDVLVLRAKNNLESKFLYALLMQDSFFDYEMKATKGSKMPCGDKSHIINFPCLDLNNKTEIGKLLSSLDDKIALNNRINAKLEQMAKRLYEHWFVQFDFPNTDGNPYKSSGGKMVWNEILKREIPDGWEVGNLYDIAEYVNGLACQNYRPKESEKSLPVIKIREMNEGITADTEKVSASIPGKYRIYAGDILFSWSASLEIKIWTGETGGLNQHIFKVIPKGYFSKGYVYQQLSAYLVNFQKMAESRKTTMGHITSDHIKQSRILIPPKEIISAFTKKTLSIFNYQLSIEKETQKLTALRDRLLPLLMNGQVEVN
ncbi:MAG: restriction endonuclease subunit S [Treponema sp.]|nr:restriction endonuclease subunit S [Treponema sp.]